MIAPITHASERFEPPESGIYLGVLLEGGGTSEEIAEFNEKAGKNHAVFANFMNFPEDDFPWNWISTVRETGAAAYLSIEPSTSFKNFFAPDWGPGQATYEVTKAFAENCKATGMKIFIRFAHEANGWWYPWCPSYSTEDNITNENYRVGFRNFSSLVKSIAPNVAIVWAPNQGNGPGELPYYSHVYPGDDYVDWVGLSVYNGEWYGNGNDVMDYQFAKAITTGYSDEPEGWLPENFYWVYSDPNNPDGHHKPMMIAETSSQFVPEYSENSRVDIASFESLGGSLFSGKTTIARFEDLNHEGFTPHATIANFEDLDVDNATEQEWWTPWGDFTFSLSTDKFEGTYAARLSGTDSDGDQYCGGVGTDVRGGEQNWARDTYLSFYVKRSNDARVDPELKIELVAYNGKTASIQRRYSSIYYYQDKIAFSEMTRESGFCLNLVYKIKFHLFTSSPGEDPADLYLDYFRRGDAEFNFYEDSVVANFEQLIHDTVTEQGWSVEDGGGAGYFTQTSDSYEGDFAVRMGGIPTLAGDNYSVFATSGFSGDERDFSDSSELSYSIKRANDGKPNPILSICFYSGDDRAWIEVEIDHTDYRQESLPFINLFIDPGFDWSNVAQIKLGVKTPTPGIQPADIYLDHLVRGRKRQVATDKDWWPAGPACEPWGDAADGDTVTWTLTTDAYEGSYALRMSGTESGNWYSGGNGASIPGEEIDWSDSTHMAFYIKREDDERVDPQLRITLEDAAGRSAYAQKVISSTTYYQQIIAFSDMTVDDGFDWAKVSAVKLEMLTTNPGSDPADIYLDDFRRGVLPSTTVEQDWWPLGDLCEPWGDVVWSQSTDANEGFYSLKMSGTDEDGDWYIGGNGCSLDASEGNWTGSNAIIFDAKRSVDEKPAPEIRITLIDNEGCEASVKIKVSNSSWATVVALFEDMGGYSGFNWANVSMIKLEFLTSLSGQDPSDLYIDHLRRAEVTVTNQENNIRWKHDWIDQLYSLESNHETSPKYVSVRDAFPNLHMINWFNIRKFEDGMIKDFTLVDEGAVPAFKYYYDKIKDPYFIGATVVFEITNAHFEPKKFKPSAGQTTTLYFELSKGAKVVKINICGGKDVVRSIYLRDVPAGLNSWIWDGRDDAGNIVVSGKYRAKIVAKSYEGERVRAKATVRVKA